MRSTSILVLAFGSCLGLMAPHQASAQSALEGPLAAPGDAAAAPAKPAKAKPHKKPAKTAHKTAPKSDSQGYEPAAADADAHPGTRSARGLPEDPVSFGMKWNGSNDTARDTRVQNYNGDAAGTGAEVGMKLHF